MTRRPRAPGARSVALLAAGIVVAGCDDAAAPERAPSDFLVEVYVEADDSVGLSSGDAPLRATVTVEAAEGDFVRVDSTGVDGRVSFAQVPAGRYVVSHEATAIPAGVALQGSRRQTVYAPFAGDSVLTRFVYRTDPDTLAGGD